MKEAIKSNETESRSELKKSGVSDRKVKTTFADKLRRMENEPMVIVKPKNVQDNKKTKSDLRSMIDPSSIQINRARNLANGGVALACGSTSASKQLQETALEKMGSNYEVQLTELKKPKIKIVGMSDELSGDEIVQRIKSQNSVVKDGDMKVVHQYVGFKGYYSAVLEVDGKTFSNLLDAGRVFIDFDSCRVMEDLHVMRCYKCCQYYHKGNECKNKMACQKCGEEHETEKCTNTTLQCVNCKVAVETFSLQLDVNHAAYDRSCPMFKRKVNVARRRISYNK